MWVQVGVRYGNLLNGIDLISVFEFCLLTVQLVLGLNNAKKNGIKQFDVNSLIMLSLKMTHDRANPSICR